MIATLQKQGISLGYVETTLDLDQLWRLDAEAYGESNLDFERLRDWWERDDQGLVVVRDCDQIVAAFGLWALNQAQIRGFIAGKIKEADLVPMRRSDLPSPFWYWSGIVVTPYLRRSRLSPLRLLLQTGVSSWIGSQDLEYKCFVYALGMSIDGLNLLNRFSFEQIRSAEEMPDLFPLFVREFSGYAEGQRILKSRF